MFSPLLFFNANCFAISMDSFNIWFLIESIFVLRLKSLAFYHIDIVVGARPFFFKVK